MKLKKLAVEQRVASTLGIKELCANWMAYEYSLDSDVDEITTSLLFNVITLNLTNVNMVSKVLDQGIGDDHMIVRLGQLYLDIVMMFGKDTIEEIHSDVSDTLLELNPTIYTNSVEVSNYKTYRARYPFIILLPIFNSLKNGILQVKPISQPH